MHRASAARGAFAALLALFVVSAAIIGTFATFAA